MAAGDINSLVVVTDRWPPDRLSGETLTSALDVGQGAPSGPYNPPISHAMQNSSVSRPAMCQLGAKGSLVATYYWQLWVECRCGVLMLMVCMRIYGKCSKLQSPSSMASRG